MEEQRKPVDGSVDESSEIARRKRAFQNENRRQMREGLLSPEDASFISREAAKSATFRFKS